MPPSPNTSEESNEEIIRKQRAVWSAGELITGLYPEIGATSISSYLRESSDRLPTPDEVREEMSPEDRAAYDAAFNETS